MLVTSEYLRNIISNPLVLSNNEKEFYSKKKFTEATSTNYNICAQCGGACCKRCGCHFSPEDFEIISFNYLKNEIKKGYISIDYVDGEQIFQDLGAYILRVRNKDAPIIDTGFRGNVPCSLLTENGCKLDYEHRPMGGKLLIPPHDTPNFSGTLKRRCHSEYDIDVCCREWMAHQEILYQLIDFFTGKDYPCSI